MSHRSASTATRVRAAVAAAAALALLAAGCSDDDGAATTTAAPATTVDPTPVAADVGDADWPVYGHDAANSRTNVAEGALHADTVGDLTLDWSRDSLVGVTGTPSVVDGVGYVGDWTGAVRAFDVATGEDRWTYQLGGSIVGSPAVVDDAVYASAGRTLVRLDRASGTEVWRVDVHDHPQAQISASPVVVDGLVLQGVASFENILVKDDYTFRGSIGAYDADTGEEVWRLLTTQDDDEGGAGAGIWSTPAVDVDRGVLYVGTGQTLEEPTAALTDALLAIDVATGELRWSTQFTYPDVFSSGNPGGKDADVGASPTLWRAAGRDLVGAGDKGGTFHVLDRDTGEVVWETVLTPGSVFGGQIGSAALVDGTIVATSNVGDPDTNAPTDRTRVFGLDAADGDVLWSTEELEGKIFGPISAVPGVAFVGTDRGQLLGLDVADGTVRWEATAPDKVGGGPSIVDGRVLWGYGFVLFQPGGDGGLLSFALEP